MYVYLCSCTILCYFTGIFYAVVRQISTLFIDNKDSVFCIVSVSGRQVPEGNEIPKGDGEKREAIPNATATPSPPDGFVHQGGQRLEPF